MPTKEPYQKKDSLWCLRIAFLFVVSNSFTVSANSLYIDSESNETNNEDLYLTLQSFNHGTFTNNGNIDNSNEFSNSGLLYNIGAFYGNGNFRNTSSGTVNNFGAVEVLELVNAGTWNEESGYLTVYNSIQNTGALTFNRRAYLQEVNSIQNDGLFQINPDADAHGSFKLGRHFDNQSNGTLTVGADTRLSEHATLLNHGNVTIDSSVRFELAGQFDNHGSLANHGGIREWNNGGLINHADGTVSNFGAVEVSDLVNAGTWNEESGNITVHNSIQNTGALTFNRQAYLYDVNSIQNDGLFQINPHADAYDSFNLGRHFDNQSNGTLNVGADTRLSEHATLMNHGNVTIDSSVRFELAGQFDNHGSLTNHGGIREWNSGGLTNHADGTVSNFGAVEVSDLVNAGTWNEESGNITVHNSIQNTGALTFNRQAYLYDVNSIQNDGLFQINPHADAYDSFNLGRHFDNQSNGTLNVGADTRLSEHATLMNHGNVTIDSSVRFELAGQFDNHGSLTNHGGIREWNSGGLTNHADGTVSNFGAVEVSDLVNAGTWNESRHLNVTRLFNKEEGSVTFKSDSNLHASNIENNGNIVFEPGSFATGTLSLIQHTGTLEVHNSLITSSTEIHSGDVRGSGSIDTTEGNLLIGEKVTVDPNVGLSLLGDVQFAGNLHIDILNDSQSDSLSTNNISFGLGSSILFDLTGFELPDVDSSYTFLWFSSLSGFENLTHSIEGLRDTVAYDILLNANSLDLVLVSTPVPVPASLPLFAAGLLGFWLKLRVRPRHSIQPVH